MGFKRIRQRISEPWTADIESMPLSGDQPPYPPGRRMLLVQDHEDRLPCPYMARPWADIQRTGRSIVHASTALR
ncbi:hypothetical protein CHELA1G11_14162 [Hyphomicrobiales bacterium]|nr:hypothetical protein CHELA1G2_10152 [Hyphomicrobiales bacterium]CAH1676663.1 hypothetical protein CHELA1G11_14162 [Hyphomicrobiales bacterium]